MTEDIAHIYGLVDPQTNQLRYVGKTIQDPKIRLWNHGCSGQGYCGNWVKSLLKKGLSPEIFIIEDVPLSEWQDAEIFWISYFRFVGASLTNLGSGGEGWGSGCPKEVARKISIASKGRKFSDEHRKKLSDAAKKRKWSDEVRQKMSEGNKKKNANYRPEGYRCWCGEVFEVPGGLGTHIQKHLKNRIALERAGE